MAHGAGGTASRRLVEGELANPGTAPPADTLKARRHITDLVLKMAQRGEIELPEAEQTPVVAI